MTILQALGFISLPQLGSKFVDKLLGTHVNQIDKWYHSKIKKPRVCPPDWICRFIWPTMYPMMGYASYLIFKNGTGYKKNLALSLYATQLGLNWTWSPIFFKKHKIGLSFLTMSVLSLNVALCCYQFHSIDKIAGYLLMPYLAWLSFNNLVLYFFWKEN